MSPDSPGRGHARVSFPVAAWGEDLVRATAAGRTVAEAARTRFERDGVPPAELRACDPEAATGPASSAARRSTCRRQPARTAWSSSSGSTPPAAPPSASSPSDPATREPHGDVASMKPPTSDSTAGPSRNPAQGAEVGRAPETWTGRIAVGRWQATPGSAPAQKHPAGEVGEGPKVVAVSVRRAFNESTGAPDGQVTTGTYRDLQHAPRGFSNRVALEIRSS